jgi:hypothetical protein
MTIILPPKSSAQVDVPVQSPHARILLNGRPYDSATAVETGRMRVTLPAGGSYKIAFWSRSNSRLIKLDNYNEGEDEAARHCYRRRPEQAPATAALHL